MFLNELANLGRHSGSIKSFVNQVAWSDERVKVRGKVACVNAYPS